MDAHFRHPFANRFTVTKVAMLGRPNPVTLASSQFLSKMHLYSMAFLLLCTVRVEMLGPNE
jgi:hypothetical protein